MFSATRVRDLTCALHTTSSWDYKVASVIAMLTASVSALRLAHDIGYSVAIHTSDYTEHIRLSEPEWSLGFVETHLLGIATGLIVSGIGLWSRKFIGFLLSFLALLWVGMNYVLWYAGTLSTMRDVEIHDFSEMPDQSQHLLALIDATWWDMVVAAITIILFGWQIRTLIVALRHCEVVQLNRTRNSL